MFATELSVASQPVARYFVFFVVPAVAIGVAAVAIIVAAAALAILVNFNKSSIKMAASTRLGVIFCCWLLPLSIEISLNLLFIRLLLLSLILMLLLLLLLLLLVYFCRQLTVLLIGS